VVSSDLEDVGDWPPDDFAASVRGEKDRHEPVAASLYWPLARIASLLEKAGADVANWPLAEYRYRSFYSMRTDALDRFGTHLEQRYSRLEIEQMMRRCGLEDIRFRDGPPYWVACGRKAPA